MKIYYGMTEKGTRVVMATITGEMPDGTKVYTEVEMREDGSIVTDDDGEPKLVLDNQYTRHLKYGTQTFCRI